MFRAPIVRVAAGVLIAAVGGLTCTDLSGPGTSLSHVGLAPRFTRAAEDALKNLANFHLDLNNLRVRLNRGDGSTAVDTVVSVNTGAESVSIELTVSVNGTEEQFNAVIELRAGDLVLFSGTQVVVAKTTGSSSSGPPIDVEYVGPGAGAVDVNVLPGEIAILSNQTAAFTAVAFDASEQELPDLLVDWTVRDAALGSVTDAGVFTPVTEARGSTWVIATLPTEVKDSARVTVSPIPTSAVLVAGADQVGAVAQVLAPFVFEVRAADQLPVAGATVSFNVSSGGGQLSAETGTTGLDGRVSTTLTLGTVPGENVVQLLVGDAVFATATATAGAGLPAALLLEGGSPISVVAGQTIAAQHALRVVDVLENPVPNVQVALALTLRGSPEVLLAATATSDHNGRVFLSALGATQNAGAFDIRATIVEPTGIAPVVVNVDVVAGGGALLAFTTQPPAAQAGAPFTVAVTMRDAQGNVATSFTGPVTVSLGNNPAQASLSGTLTRSAVAGVATFDDLVMTRAATGYTLSATAAELEPVSSVAFNVDAAAVATLAFTAQPTTVGPGLPFTVGVVAQDAFGNPVTGFAGTVSLALGNNPSDGSLGGTTTATAASGVATFSNLTISAAGSGYTLVAASSSLNGTSAAIDVVDGFRVTWIAAAGGAWSNGANWDRGTPPTAGDTAIVDLNGTFTITLDQSASVASLYFGGTTGQQRLQIAANTLNVSTLSVFTQNSVLELSGGSIDGAGGIILNGQFFWTGGTLTGAGSLQTVAGSLTEISGGTKTLTQRFVGIGGNGTWQGGDIFSGSGGQLHVLAGGSLAVGANVTFNYNLGGTISSFVNGGTLTTAGTVVISGAFNNAGALSVDAGLLTLLGGGSWVPTSVSLADDAIINFANGSHAVGGNVALTGAGEVQVTGATVSIVGTYSSTGITRVTAGTLFFDPTEPATLSQLFLTNGTLSGGGTVNVTNQFTWSGGTLSGVGTTNVLAGATATLDGAVKSLTNRTLAIAGSGSWTVGNINSGSAGQVSVLAGGSLTIPGGVQMQYNLGGAMSALSNAGTLSMAGSIAISSAMNNSGTLDVQTGAIVTLSGGGTWSGAQGVTIGTSAMMSLAGGTHTLGGTITVSGTGEMHFSGASATLTGAYTSTGVTRISSGSATFANTQAATTTQLVLSGGTLGGTGQLDVSQAFTWSGGGLSGLGVLNVLAGATASLEGGVKSMTERLLQIGGTATWSSGDINSGSGAQLTIAPGGSLATPGGVLMHYNLGGGMPALNNAGTLTTNGTLGVSTMFNNSATLSVESGTVTLSGGGTWSGTQGVTVANGAMIALTGGTHSLGGAISVAGTGEMRFDGANATVTGTYSNTGITRVSSGTAAFSTASSASTAQLVVSGGTLSGTGQIDVSGALTWSGGAMSGTGITQVNSGATATLNGVVKSLTERTVLLVGNGSWTAGDINSGSSGHLSVAAGASLSVTGAIMHYNLGGTISTLSNAGTLVTNGTVNVGAAFNNSGAVAVQSGSLTLLGGGAWTGAQGITITAGALALQGGTFTLDGALDVTGGGSIVFSGATASVIGTFASSTFTRVTAGSVAFNTTQPATLAQLEVTGTGVLTGTSLVDVDQSFTWSGGSLTGPGTTLVDVGATAALDVGAKTLVQRTLAIGGNGTWSAGDISTGSAAQVHILPTGSLAITGNVGYLYTLGGTISRFVVEGTLQPSASVTMGAPFDNRGSLVVESGTFTMSAGGAWSGSLNVGINLNAVVDLTAGNFTHEGLLTTMGLQSGIGIMRLSGADLQITGSYRVIGATEVNAGRLIISQDFDVSGLLTHNDGQISVTGNTIFAGQENLGRGTLLLGGNFSLTANGDNLRMLSTPDHITRFVGDATNGRTLEWSQPSGAQVASRFGQLDIASTGAEGVVLSSTITDATTLTAAHLLIRANAILHTTGSPRFVLALGGVTGQGIFIESQGRFDNLAGSTVQIANFVNCNPALELVGLMVTGQYSCLSQ